LKLRLSPLAKALIAAFLFASSLACGPFSQFLQNGGRGILTRINQNQMRITYARLSPHSWQGIWDHGQGGINLKWGDYVSPELLSITRGTVRVEEYEEMDENYYHFSASNGEYEIYFSTSSEYRGLASLFMENLMASSTSLSYLSRLREYTAAAKYVSPSEVSIEALFQPLFKQNEGWPLLALPSLVYISIGHLLLRWQLPIIAAFPELNFSILMSIWRVGLALPLLIMVSNSIRTKTLCSLLV